MSKKLVERYISAALLPYLLLSLVILTAILLTQQTAKFTEVLGSARAPLRLAGDLMLGLLPNVLIFTLPMSMLVGTATGFSRLGSDSEIIAMRAAGVGTWRIVSPVLLLGGVLSALTVYVGFVLAPAAAQDLRETALRAALYRLESPIEPRSFYTDLPGKVIYVRDGDQAHGRWGRIFIYWQEGNNQARLITARSGHTDITGDRTELVLRDAVVNTLPQGGVQALHNGAQLTTERSESLRLRDDRLSEGRNAIMKRIREREKEFDEMGWGELSVESGRVRGGGRRSLEASNALHKRLSLCLAPLVFAFFGVGLGLRVRRGGRGLGVILSMAAMIIYYLISLVGEQLWRAGALRPAVGAWLAFALSMGFSALLMWERLRDAAGRNWKSLRQAVASPKKFVGVGARAVRGQTFSGLLDRGVLGALCRNFAGAFLALVSIFLVFTLFELLRFVALDGSRAGLVGRYLVFLLPFVSVAVAPLAVLISVLITYALLVRRSEAVAWWASGQSIYRLVIPALFFGAFIGLGLWLLQERVMPAANSRQNALRAQIRGGVVSRTETAQGRQWLASADGQRLYSYESGQGADGVLGEPSVYEFDGEGVHLERMILGRRGVWGGPKVLGLEGAEVLVFEPSRGVRTASPEGGRVALAETEPPESFKLELNKPSEASAGRLSAYIRSLLRRGEVSAAQPLQVALGRKYADPLAPLVMVLVGSPLAMAFGRRSAVTALCVAVLTGLAFWGATSGFQQLGVNGMLPPLIAAWGPPFIFGAVGLYLLSRTRT